MFSLKNLFQIERKFKFFLIYFIDYLLMALSVFCALSLFNNKVTNFTIGPLFASLFNFTIFFFLTILFKNYKIIYRYYSILDIWNYFKTIICSIITILVFDIFINVDYFFFNVSYLINQYSIFFVLSILFRFLIKKIYQNYYSKNDKPTHSAFIYGAGTTGLKFENFIKQKINVLGYIDDDKTKNNLTINNKKIYSFDDFELFYKKNKTIKVYICIPSISTSSLSTVINKLNLLNIDFEIIDENFFKNKLNEKNLNITDNKLNFLNFKKTIFENKIILITGAAGTIGKELTDQLIILKPKKIIMLDNSEIGVSNLLSDINLKKKIRLKKLEIKLINLCNLTILKQIFKKNKIDYVFHAAAYKHISIIEENVKDASYNNIISLLNLIEISKKFKVKKLIFISSDKAVNPINILGFCKRIGEKIIKISHKNNLEMTSVRFGNVIGSSGSLIPKIKNQIEKYKVIFLSHKNAKRYFMTLQDAINLVIESSQMKLTGDIFVLNMGNQIKIYDIAKLILKNLNLKEKINNKGDIKITYTGLNKGEKIAEELFNKKLISKTENEKIIKEKLVLKKFKSNYISKVKNLFKKLDYYSDDKFKKKLKKLV